MAKEDQPWEEGFIFHQVLDTLQLPVQLHCRGRMGGVRISSGIGSSPDSGSVATSSADAASTCLYALRHNDSLVKDARY